MYSAYECYAIHALGNRPPEEFRTLEEARAFVARKLASRPEEDNPYRIIYIRDEADPTQVGVMRDVPGREVA